MKGIWFTARGKTEFMEEDRPVCKPGTALLKTRFSGLSNGTERNKLMGGNYHSGSYPDRIGYQHVSEILEVGEGFTRFEPGDIVFSATFPGHVPYHLLKQNDLAVKLSGDFDPIAACLMGVASVSMHDARLARITVNDRVLVIGAGLIGLYAVAASNLLGASVTAVDRHFDRLDLATKMGAERVLDNSAGDAWDVLAEDDAFTACLECSGSDILDKIICSKQQGGMFELGTRLVMVAGRNNVTIDFNRAFACRLEVHFTAHFDQDDLEQVYRLAAAGRLELRGLVREVVPIHDAVRIYSTLRDDKSSLLGTVFDWTVKHDLE
ncbi:MAG: zinc-binding dehydrogenase [Spirochaetales bacterium]|jgi:2-desacetyl-2-hydroxyethyl bacteriochlorophyllide A dehydrogenase|nr:zinc-binding dehydrogenase [Spirochaetales bacterium]